MYFDVSFAREKRPLSSFRDLKNSSKSPLWTSFWIAGIRCSWGPQPPPLSNWQLQCHCMAAPVKSGKKNTIEQSGVVRHADFKNLTRNQTQHSNIQAKQALASKCASSAPHATADTCCGACVQKNQSPRRKLSGSGRAPPPAVHPGVA